MGLAKITVVVWVLLLTACELKPILEDRFDPAVYIVERGDSIHSIAWRNRLDFKQVIVWNGLQTPYIIYPGQRLTLHRPAGFVLPTAKSVPVTVVELDEPEVITTALSVDEGSGFDSEPLKADPVKQATFEKPAKEPISEIKLAVTSRAGLEWSWPTRGRLVKKYQASNRLSPGLDLAGKKGQTVRSVADGVVVVSNAVRGYGNLLLIEHKSNYISAYMYNDRLLVSEGHRVKRGEQIALMGHQVGKKQAVLHFEIRKDGEPIDPELYLPRRSE